jgi:predicted nucleic acid-binding protein
LFPETSYASPDDFVEQLFNNVFENITMKMSFSDALILSVAEERSCSKFVTWNIKHFEGRTDIPVKTPEEMLNL